MNTDIRIAIGLTSNPKVLKLMKRCGDRSFFCLISLWTWAAQNRPDGNLEGMDAEDVELSSKWTGAEGCFIGCLKDLRFIDQEPDGSFSIHDWAENNPWAAEAKERSEAARLSRLFRKNPGAAQMLKTQGRVGITPDEYQLYVRETKEERTKYDRTANPSTPAPVPVPAPDPEPTPKEVCTKTLLKDLPDSANRVEVVCSESKEREQLSEKPDPIPYSKIIDHLNAQCGCQFKPTSNATKRHIKARWAEGFRLPDFEAVIDHKRDEWAQDSRMCVYLRPETLFSTKFEGYLQAAKNGHPGACGAGGKDEQLEQILEIQKLRGGKSPWEIANEQRNKANV